MIFLQGVELTGVGGVPLGQWPVCTMSCTWFSRLLDSGTPTKCRKMPSCLAGSVPKSSSGPPRGAPWVTLTTEGVQASTGALTSDHWVPHPSYGQIALQEGCTIKDFILPYSAIYLRIQK